MDPVHVVWVQLQVAGLSAEVWPASAARLRRSTSAPPARAMSLVLSSP